MIFLLFLALPFVEVGIALVLVREFGFANTFFAWLVSSVLGIGLIRTSSLRLTIGVAQALRQGQPPGIAALDGALIGLAGVLLLIPGFLSDFFAVLLLIPPFRKLCALKLLSTVKVRTGHSSNESERETKFEDASHAIIDVDAVVIEDEKRPNR